MMTSQQDVINGDHHEIAQAKNLKSYKNTDTSTRSSISTILHQQKNTFTKLFQEINNHFDISNTAMDRSEINKLSSDIEVHADAEVKKRSAEQYNSFTDLDNQNITLQQRSGSNLPWLCRSTTNWRDLGRYHYPRFLKEILCLSDDCMRGAYSCRPQMYPVKVLSARGPGELVNIGLPLELRSAWTLADRNVSVGCMCGI